ncbi:5'-methylthioadenosine/S-adenosylhomocysteine nucleosidase [Halobacillus karajensis]|uniref:5'-methylthioadenosine/S-adenosylhomocysteine nucleosidase n=1 Tax=Halobacillus karajensis TaxID=195088 RepID=A0A024P6Z2_9BACI|nr:5'-methylthioadenosine/S-adenosylhomocysteine nucleosidase [Halobacillus karajensis]CDQ18080.1 5'-methylthioadenosine/S-adenosylhomocysteine nucleosidase [Halobacillus karajensis]CDQ24431.1 5'-methylthioadenosine/S-adenosylhomocysteine nucleosidase [Halobacillus karajensis]CDQ29321.1 5'-methylthioadenosine/S-adenosylhomocysteine nucleosidase [Halobacillus karajensis]
MAIGIIGAMDEEVELLKSKIQAPQEKEIAGSLFIEGSLHGHEVVLLKSGIGKVNAAMSTTILHEQYDIEAVINTGSAGGFARDLEVGDVVISSMVTHHDVDVTAFQYEYGQVPGMPAMYPADQNLVSQAMEAVKKTDANASKGIIATGDSFMQEEKRVDFVRGKFPEMIAAEMEAAAIAQVCFKYGTPFVVIRALSDIAGKESSVSFDQFLPKAAENAALMIMEMVRNYA